MKFTKNGAYALIFLFGMITLSCKSGDKSQQAEQQAPELAVLTVGEEDTKMETAFPATLRGEKDVEIRPQITGFLTKVHVEDGQRVNKGQVLFTIDQVSLQAAVDAAKAQVEVAQANVNTAKTNANNNKILLDKNIISAPAYQTSLDALNVAIAQLNAAKANLTNAQKNLTYSVITAPASGVVGIINFKEGALVSPSSLLTELSGNADMEAIFSINEKELLALTDDGKRNISDAIKLMPEVTFKLANGEIYDRPGKIVSISGVIDSTTGSAVVTALFPNPNGTLHTGNTGQVLLPNIRTNSIVIPQAATFEIQDMKFVYLVGDSSKVHSTPIQIDTNNDGQNYIVTGGLKPGDVIVTEGVGISVKDGMTIRPKK